jgi:hypothetical protein
MQSVGLSIAFIAVVFDTEKESMGEAAWNCANCAIS